MQAFLATNNNASAAGRHEIKIIVPGHLGSMVDGWIRLHPEGFRTEYPSRRVNSLYYDTLNWDSLRDNAAGISERSKLRLRWYGSVNKTDHLQLEIKSRRAGLVSKQTEPIDGDFEFDGTLAWPEFKAAISNSSPLFQHETKLVVPTIVTSYERDYFVTFDNRIRLTLDKSLRYHRVASGDVQFSPAPIGEKVFIIEVKGNPSEVERIMDITRKFPLRPGQNSKFVHASLTNLL
jgi:hypothetical protein